MPQHSDSIRSRLLGGVLSARQLLEKLGISQPTLSRALSLLGDEIVRIGAGKSIQYALRDTRRGLPEIPVYRVTTEGRTKKLGVLIPVSPEGFVMRQEDGVTLHSDGIPWWLFDMLPQGYLGRAYATRIGTSLGFSAHLNDWDDTQSLRALLEHGYDAVGNLLLGDNARDYFLNAAPVAVSNNEYPRLARDAARGEIPGSSAGGEQPKFTAYTLTPDGERHVIVKFSEPEPNPVSERWRDLLLAEHIALETLRDAGIPAATCRIIDYQGQRFLESERFDRMGRLGRCAVHSLKALDAEFVGSGVEPWPMITGKLACGKIITQEAANHAALLWAFGMLIGNTDMHGGNLSFVALHGRPYDIAPAYDMVPMAFAPRSGGGLPDAIPEPTISAYVDNVTWRKALDLARVFMSRLRSAPFSARFDNCLASLENHIMVAAGKIGRLG